MKRLFAILPLICLAGNALAFDYYLGDNLITYSSQANPAKGASYTDSPYGTTVTRITNRATDGHGQWGVGCGYSTWAPHNSNDNALLLYLLSDLNTASGYAVFKADGTYVKTLSTLQWFNSQDPEPRWDSSGNFPNRVYYRTDKQLRAIDVSNDNDILIHDFATEYPSTGTYISNGEEGIQSWDNRYWAFALWTNSTTVHRLIVYDQVNDNIIASKAITAEPNSVSMSPSGDYVYAAYDYISGANTEFDGPHAYTRDLTSNVKISSGIPHLSFAYDAQGHEVAHFMDSDMVSYVHLDNGTKVDLYAQADLGWAESNLLHTATPQSKKGWAFIATYSANNTEWDYNQIFSFELDDTKCYTGCDNTPRIWRVAFTQNLVGANYYYNQPNLQMSKDGMSIYWGANWRTPQSATDVYMVALPTNWWEDLGGTPASDTTPAAFSFTDNTGVALSTGIYSTSVQVLGIDNTCSISLAGAGCEYKVNAGAWATANDNVTLNDNVALRVTSSASHNTAVSCVLNLGGVSDTWSVTTLAVVDDPQTPRFRGSSMSGGWR